MVRLMLWIGSGVPVVLLVTVAVILEAIGICMHPLLALVESCYAVDTRRILTDD